MATLFLSGLLLAATAASRQYNPGRSGMPFSPDFYDIASIPIPSAVPAPPSTASTSLCADHSGPRRGLVCLSPGVIGLCDERRGKMVHKGTCPTGMCCRPTTDDGPAECSAEACELYKEVYHHHNDDEGEGGVDGEEKRPVINHIIPAGAPVIPYMPYNPMVTDFPEIPEIPADEDDTRPTMGTESFNVRLSASPSLSTHTS